MKKNLLWMWSLGLVLALPLAVSCVQQASSATENITPALETVTDSGSALQSDAGEAATVLDQTPEEDISTAPARPVSTEKPLPPTLRATGPVSEIMKLADAGLDESVMLAFVNKSSSTFNLRSDEIIYLKDIGIPNSVVTAMIQHDETLRESLANAAATAAAPANPPDSPGEATAAAPAAEAAPQADYTGAPNDSVEPQPAAVTDASFYDSLAPYGSWVDVDGYGRCWQPTVVVVNSGWRPYFDCGRWLYTDCGWYWRSDYSWGWAPFHYGRWFRHQNLGWCWTPDTVWGPSWVSWRYNRDYCGWAPLPPSARFSVGVGFASHGRGHFGLGADCFAFVPFSHFRDRQLTHHALPHDQVNRVFGQTIVSTGIHTDHNRVVNTGITPEHVAAVTRTKVPRVTIHDATVAGGGGSHADRLDRNGGTLSVFRPPLTHAAGTQPASREGVRAENNPPPAASLAGHGIHTIPLSTRTDAVRPTPAGTSARGTSIILRGPDRSTQSGDRNSVAVQTPAPSHNSLILIGRKDVTTGRSLPPQYLSGNDSSRSSANQNSQQFAATASQPQTPSYSSWPRTRSSDSAGRVDRQPAPNVQSSFENRLASRAIAPQTQLVPSRHTPSAFDGSALTSRAETPRYSPPPSPALQHTRSAPSVESHTRPAPPAPAPAPSAAHSRSSDRNSR